MYLSSSDILEHVKKNNLQPAPVSKVKLPAPAAPPAQPAPSIPQSAPSAPVTSAPSPKPKKFVEYHQVVDTEENVFDDKALTSMRKVIAKRLTESKVCVIETCSRVCYNHISVLYLNILFFYLESLKLVYL